MDFSDYVPLVPTSAITGDGMGDLIALMVNYSQNNLTEKLMLSKELEAIVLEVSSERTATLLLLVAASTGESDQWSWYDRGHHSEGRHS